MKRASLLLALLACACATGAPAPISYGGGARAPAPSASPPPAPSRAAPEVARTRDGTLRDYALQPEEAHPFDPANPPRTHRVRAGESLYDIAALYQAPLRALIEQNGLDAPFALSEGRVLRLPPPRFHTVERGETFEAVARRYNVDTRSLALLNRMSAPYAVRPGDRIVLPAEARQDAGPAPVSEEPAPRNAAAEAGDAAGRFAWPLQGEIVARFGAQPGGARLDGIEIAGRVGAPVSAAGDGEVVYTGADLPTYGTVVLIQHAGNYVTTYAFARRALVREGDRVRAGQPIAELGERQDGQARLLFQVRRGATAIDPAPLLQSAR